MRLPFLVPRDPREWDVVGLGLNSVDLLAVVAEHPAPDSKQKLERFARLPGGQTATAMAACARLGWRARYVGTFGDDDMGALGLASLVQEHVDVSASRTVAGATSQFAVILVDGRSGHRTVLWDRHPLLAMDPAAVPLDVVTSGRLMLVDCHETAAATVAARAARAAGIPTIIDVEKVRRGIGDLLKQIDVIIAATEFPSALTGYADVGRALRAVADEYQSPLVCVTLGSEGSLALCQGREIRTPAHPITCLDSTGAGDAFRGGFAAACLRWPEGPVEDVLAFANVTAALNCRGLGARGGLPTLGEVLGGMDSPARV